MLLHELHEPPDKYPPPLLTITLSVLVRWDFLPFFLPNQPLVETAPRTPAPNRSFPASQSVNLGKDQTAKKRGKKTRVLAFVVVGTLVTEDLTSLDLAVTLEKSSL